MKAKGYFGYMMLYLLIFLIKGQILCAEQFPTVVEAEVRAVVAAEREGVISGMNTDVGDRVKKGGVIAVVYHKDILFEKQQLQAKQKYFSVQVENLGKLNEKGMVPNEELARAQMDKAVNEAQIKLIDTQIGRSTVYAPFSGIAVARHIQSHEWVRPGQPVVELYDPARLRVVADIPSEIAMKMKTGQVDTLVFPDTGKEVNAKLKVISPQVDVRSNTIKVYWSVDPKEGEKGNLIPGMKGVFQWN